jgi:C1A family cysteine protease
MIRLARQTKVDRRQFLNGATALAAGVAADSVIPRSAWAATDFEDLRTYNYITPVKNQDSCNACTAFAVVATIEGTYHKQIGLDNEPLNLSEAQLFFAAGPRNKCDASHWWPEDALAYCASVGLAREEPTGFTRKGTKDLIKIKGAKRLLHNKLEKTQDAMKQWITDKGPVIAVMLEYSDFYNYRGGAAPYVPGYSSTNPSPFIVGGHAVSIVGYDARANKNHWICKNSYGKEWNTDGYVNIPLGQTQNNKPATYIDSIDVWGVTFS